MILFRAHEFNIISGTKQTPTYNSSNEYITSRIHICFVLLERFHFYRSPPPLSFVHVLLQRVGKELNKTEDDNKTTR
jgi:hypothetical protein